MLSEFKLINQFDNLFCELRLDRVRMLEEPHFAQAIIQTSLVQVLAHFYRYVRASFMITAAHYLAKRTPAQLLQSFVPEC